MIINPPIFILKANLFLKRKEISNCLTESFDKIQTDKLHKTPIIMSSVGVRLDKKVTSLAFWLVVYEVYEPVYLLLGFQNGLLSCVP